MGLFFVTLIRELSRKLSISNPLAAVEAKVRKLESVAHSDICHHRTTAQWPSCAGVSCSQRSINCWFGRVSPHRFQVGCENLLAPGSCSLIMGLFSNNEQGVKMNELIILNSAIKAASPWVQLRVCSETPDKGAWNDAVVALDLKSGSSTKYRVEVKRTLTTHVIKYLIDKAPEDRRDLLLVAPYVTEGVAQLCIDQGLNFLDTAGNAYIDHPERLIYIAGQPAKNSIRDSLSSSKKVWATGSGLRIIFNLLQEPNFLSYNYRVMAEISGVALGSVSKVMGELEADGHLIKGKRLVDPEELARTWAMYYSSVLRPKLNTARYSLAGSINDEYTPWRSLDLFNGDAAWGGEEGAYRRDGYLQPASATLYSWKPRHLLMGKYRLKPDSRGQIEILDAFWRPLVFDGSEVPDLLIYADLIGSADSRNHEAAERIWPRISGMFNA